MQYVKRIIQAGAGTGKTTLLIDEALNLLSEGRVLYLTFTRNNLKSMKEDIVNKKGMIAPNIECRTWSEFLMNELVKPYRKKVKLPLVEGLDNTVENEIPKRRGINADHTQYYFNISSDIYSERLSMLIEKISEKTNKLNYKRIEKIYSTILIDEIQDLNGYDLAIIKEFHGLNLNIIYVGDHRQATYSTNTRNKYSKYKGVNIFNFFRNEMKIDDIENMEKCYRCNQIICNYVNDLYEDLDLKSERDVLPGEGLFLLRSKEELIDFTRLNNPTVLYINVTAIKKAKNLGIQNNLEFMSFGSAKGITRKNVLILPTADMKNHALGKSINFKSQTLAKYYVALTRAQKSVAIYVG